MQPYSSCSAEYIGYVMVSVSVPAGVLIQGHCCALMLELLFGHVSMSAWGAECSAVLAVVWACVLSICSDAALLCSDAGAVVGCCPCMRC